MIQRIVATCLSCCVVTFLLIPQVHAQLPEQDQRYHAPHTLNTLRTFTPLTTRADWQREAADIRTHILVSCGLWPLPAKTPLNAHIFGRKEMDGYILEKVYIETYPGFYLGGNLYRPLNAGKGPYPAVLNPHGHWKEGRLVDNDVGSVRARCITQARMGMIAFAYDMVGYNDTIQLMNSKGDINQHKKFGLNPEDQLWSISLMGLQLWNSIRAVDFLSSLPEVDPKRIACTGASGGGTQTFMLAAVDDRISVTAPCVMVSHSMQGGCTCENAPGLRVDISNMEIAATAAPRPQIMLSATGDWTKEMLKVEGPAVASVYHLLNADKNIRYVQFKFQHNYNKTSREAVYPWLGTHLLRKPDTNLFNEASYEKLPDKDMLCFPDGKQPANAKTFPEFMEFLRQQDKAQLGELAPANKSKLQSFQRTLEPAWRHDLQLEIPSTRDLLIEAGDTQSSKATHSFIGRQDRGDRIPVAVFAPMSKGSSKVIVLASPLGQRAFIDAQDRPTGLAATLVQRGCTVVVPELFQTGSLYQKALAGKRNYFTNFFTTYNRTDAQERAQDLVTTITYARTLGKKVALCGVDRAGLWAMLAAPAADAAAVDAQRFNSTNEHLLLADDLFFPGMERLGGFDGILALCAPHPLLLHNIGSQFSTTLTEPAYASSGHKNLRVEQNRFDDLALATWLNAF